MREYAANNRDVLIAANRRWIAKNPEKRRAQVAVSNAIRDGHLVKPAACSICRTIPDTGRKLQAHHVDYSKPLEVEWLCTDCHRVQDAMRRENEAPR